MSTKIQQIIESQGISIMDFAEGLMCSLKVDGPSLLVSEIINTVIRDCEGDTDKEGDDIPENILRLAAAESVRDIALALIRYSDQLEAEAKNIQPEPEPSGKYELIVEVRKSESVVGCFRHLTNNPHDVHRETMKIIQETPDIIDWGVANLSVNCLVIEHKVRETE